MTANVEKKLSPLSAVLEDAPLIDQESRLEARVRLDRNIVVEAGAGTGKTTLLTDRLLFILLGAGVPVTDIVALTFTEKAAGEIRWRLSERLIELLDFLRESDKSKSSGRWTPFASELHAHFRVDKSTIIQRTQAALENLDKAMIGTLHHFATHLLRAYPLQAKVSPSFQIDEGELFFGELFSSEWAQWLDVELGENAPREKEWMAMLQETTLESLESLARELCHPRVDLDRIGELHPDIERWIRETIELIPAELSRQPVAKGKMEERLKQVLARLERLTGGKDAQSRDFRSAISKAQWPKGWDARNRKQLEMAGHVAEAASPEGEAMLRVAVGLVRPFVERFRKAYAWRGWITFDGILLCARDLVRDHAEVREEIKGRYRTFLIDEFQDTDPLQGELLMYLAEKPGQCARCWQDTLLESGKLFVVGDPKQSIYRFRGADLAAYERFVRHLRGQNPPALLCDLKTNFRSHGGLLGPINSVFGKIMVYTQGLQPGYKPIHPRTHSAAETNPHPAMELVTVVNPDSKDKGRTDVASTRRAEAQWITDWIEAHCGDGKKHKLKDVALLLRTTTPLAGYLEEFRAREIPYVVESEKYFYGTQEIQDFLNLLKALADPEDPVPLVGLLRSPLVGLSDREILNLREANALRYGARDPRVWKEESRARLFFRTLSDLRRLVGRLPLADLIQEVLSRTHLLELLPAAYHGQQTLSNLLKFGRMAARAADAEGSTLQGFIRRISLSIAEAQEEGESPLADEHLDAVRILTIHKAKGLEYPVVIVPNLSGTNQSGSRERSVWMDWERSIVGLRLAGVCSSISFAYLSFLEKIREQSELTRILYVALTRAKEKLILIGAKQGAARSMSTQLEEAGFWPVPAATNAAGTGREDVQARDLRPVRVHEVPVQTLPRLHGRSAKTSASQDLTVDLRALAEGWKKRVARCEAWTSAPRITSPTAMSVAVGQRRGEGLRASPTALGHEQDKPFSRMDMESPSKTIFAFGNSIRRQLSPKYVFGGEDSCTCDLFASATVVTGVASWVGQVCHRVLEGWDFADPKASLEDSVSSTCRLLAPQARTLPWEMIRTEAEDILRGFLSSPKARELASVEILGREIPFVFGRDGTVIHGSIDLIYRRERECVLSAGTSRPYGGRYRREGKIIVADYKTDKIASGSGLSKVGRDLEKHAESYRKQGEIYLEAVRRALGVEALTFSLIFLRTGEFVELK